MDLAAGTLVDGKYRVVRPIGRGGMGAVYEVENVRIRKTVAMKLLSANAADDVVKRFEKEAQAAGQIGSEHIVEVHDLGTMPTGEPYMVMELLEGETLRQRLHREKRLTAEASVPILVQILEGLGAAHSAGIVHRDLKPENIYLCSQRGGLRDWVKVLDFGISKFASVSEDGMTKTGQVIGTPQYMAPEQIKAPHTVDGRTDLYAVGVIFYQLLTGHIPFKAKTYAELLFKVVYEPLPHPTSFVADLDREACEIVLIAMSREPSQRFPNAAAFRDRLVQLGTRLGAAPQAHTADPMRAFLVASSAGLPRANADGVVPSATPSRPHGSPPSFSGAPQSHPGAPFGPPQSFATPHQPAGGAPQHHTPSAQHPSVPGSTPWPTGASWPGGSAVASQGARPGGAPNGLASASAQPFGPPGYPDPADVAPGSYQPQAATQLFPMSSSSPSHPSLAASMAQSRASVLGSSINHPPPSSAAFVPTPNPSFGGVPVQEPMHTLASNGGRKTAVAVAAAVFAIGLGATAFVVTRTSSPAGSGVDANGTHVEATSQPVATPAAPSNDVPPARDDPPAASGSADPSTVPSANPSATPSAPSATPAAVPSSSADPPNGLPRTPGPRPIKPKKDFGY